MQSSEHDREVAVKANPKRLFAFFSDSKTTTKYNQTLPEIPGDLLLLYRVCHGLNQKFAHSRRSLALFVGRHQENSNNTRASSMITHFAAAAIFVYYFSSIKN